MSREIKFRAWNKEVKKMVDIQKITPLALNDAMNDQLALQGRNGLFLPFFPEIELMQYTGLKDKNSKEIYEGDIIKWDELGDVGYISYMSETTEYIVDEWKKGDKKSKGHSLSSFASVEVIGNIHENPELLNNPT